MTFSKRILINAGNLTGVGAQAGSGLSLIPPLLQAMSDCEISLLLPDLATYHELEIPPNTMVNFVKCHSGFSNDFHRFDGLIRVIPQLARRRNVDVCLSLGDFAPMRMPCPNVIFFHQPLLLYENETHGLNGWPLYKRLFLTSYFAHSAGSAACVIVQTPVMADRLKKKFNIGDNRVAIVPYPTPRLEEINAVAPILHPLIRECSKPQCLLFLAYYYPHKNHAILPKVAEELRNRGMVNDVHIFTTISEDVFKSTRLKVEFENYPDVITNLGHLSLAEVAGALRSSNALFLPTLAESYGNIYLEAMNFRLPILTSDRDFARWMCRDFAIYFDPLDPVSIVDSIQAFPCFVTDKDAYCIAVGSHLQTFHKDWHEVALIYADILRGV